MKRLLLITLLLLAPLALQAQTMTPEFVVRIGVRNSATNDTALKFGFDPRATAGYDATFGEQQLPGFGAPASGDFLAGIEYAKPQSDIWSYTSILPKPTTDSFYLQYKFHIYGGTYPVHLTWNQGIVHEPVTGILITPPSANSGTLLDLSQGSSFDIQVLNNTADNHDAGNWTTAVLTIFYNMQPVFPTNGVSDAPPVGTGLIQSLVAYPNPMVESGALSLTLGSSARLVITGYDVTGREVLRTAKNGIAGENVIDLSGLATAKGALLIRVDASTATGSESKSVVVMRQ